MARTRSRCSLPGAPSGVSHASGRSCASSASCHTSTWSTARRRSLSCAALAESAADLRAATGTEPVLFGEDDTAPRAIVRAAEEFEATLIVIGSRALAGAKALRSVSERVAHEARCSVLVMRG